MWVAVLMIDFDTVADVGAIQIRRWGRKAVVGIGRFAIGLGWRGRFRRRWCGYWRRFGDDQADGGARTHLASGLPGLRDDSARGYRLVGL